jgi:hypothetical protein
VGGGGGGGPHIHIFFHKEFCLATMIYFATDKFFKFVTSFKVKEVVCVCVGGGDLINRSIGWGLLLSR